MNYLMNNIVYRILIYFSVLLQFGCSENTGNGTNTSTIRQTQSIPLFNGYNFNGWKVNADYFWIEDSAIVAGNLDGPNEEMLWVTTKKQYGDFVLDLDVKLVGGNEEESANGGIYFRCHYDEEKMLVGYETDMWMNTEEPDSIWWGSLHDPFGRDFDEFNILGDQDSLRKVLNVDGWNHFKIHCKGRQIKIWLNGILTADFIEYDESVSPTGIIGLQLHDGPPTRVWYKNVTIQEL